MRVKVYGAGSIGNHLTQASRRAGHSVDVVDVDAEALRRMREDIYPTRYGEWDSEIGQFTPENEPKGGYDLICLGTPPDVRMRLAQRILEEAPRAILLEKPLAAPSLEGVAEFFAELPQETKVFIGYDHAIAPSITHVRDMLSQNTLGEILAIDVEFREHWGGIFAAHPWLSGPTDTYLGFTKRGGGASGEHSHALHLLGTLATSASWGEPQEVAIAVEYDETKSYDKVATFAVRYRDGHIGRVVQDVLTKPPRKYAFIQGSEGTIEWRCNGGPEKEDVVVVTDGEGKSEQTLFPKKRPDDFFFEINHIGSVLDGSLLYEQSPIAVQTGLTVLEILGSVFPNTSYAGPIKKLAR